MASVEFPRISGSPNSGKSLPLQLGVEVVSVLSLSIFLGLSRLGSAPNSIPGALLAQLPYAARTASSDVRLRLSLRSSLLAGIVSAAAWLPDQSGFFSLHRFLRFLPRCSRTISYMQLGVS